MNIGRSPRTTGRRSRALGRRWLALTVPLDEADEIRRQFGKIGQRFMDHDRLGSGGSGGGTPGRALGRDALALHQKDGLVVFAGQDGVIAFDEHAGSIRAGSRWRKVYIALLETTRLMQYMPVGIGDINQ